LPFESVQGSLEGNTRRIVLFHQIYAEIHAYAGDTARALDALRRAADGGLIDIFWVDRCPLFAPIRGDASFAASRAIVLHRAHEILDAYRGG
jgi:serine/threonine-protein kinase